MRLCVCFFVILSLNFCGSCDHVRIETCDQFVSMGGNIEGIDYDLSNFSVRSVAISNATGAYRDERLDIFLRGGNISVADNNVEITNASLVDLHYMDNVTVSEVWCMGSFNVSQKINRIDLSGGSQEENNSINI